MKPLSILKYVKCNFKKVFILLIPMIFSLALIQFGYLIIETCNEDFSLNFKNDEKVQIFINTSDDISDIRDGFKKMKSVEGIYKGDLNELDMGNIVFSGMGRAVISYTNESKDYFIEKFNSKLIEGHYPTKENEIALSINAAKYKKLKLGDFIGTDVKGTDDLLSGKYKIVGIVKNESIVSYCYTNTPYVLFVKCNYTKEVSDFVSRLKNDDRVYISTYEDTKNNYKDIMSTFKIVFYLIATILLIVMVITMRSMCYVSYYNRIFEFALVNALGYGRRYIHFRILKEMIVTSIASLFFGVTLATLFCTIFNYEKLYKNGIYIKVFSPNGIPIMIFILVIVIVSNLFSLEKIFKKKDLISVIEGEE